MGASQVLSPVFVAGSILKAELEQTTPSRVRDSETYLVWPVGTPTKGRVPVHFIATSGGSPRNGQGSVGKDSFRSWLPATSLVALPPDASTIASDQLVAECSDEVRGDQRELQPAGLVELADLLSVFVDSSVRVSLTAECGVLSIDFRDLEDLERICSVLMNGSDD